MTITVTQDDDTLHSVDTNDDSFKEKTLAEVINEMQPSSEGRVTFRLLRNDLLMLSKFCRGLDNPTTMQVLFERAVNEWFMQRGIRVCLNCSTKQGVTPDPLAEYPVVKPLPIGQKPVPLVAQPNVPKKRGRPPRIK